MATARLVYETSENLDARTLAHAPIGSWTRQLIATDDLVISLHEGVTAWGVDGVLRWELAHDEDVLMLGIIGDELVAVGREKFRVWGLDGEHRRDVELSSEWMPTHIAFDEFTRRIAMIGEAGVAAIVDVDSGAQVHHWDMCEDYEFGDYVAISALLFRHGRMITVVGQQIVEWADGELERTSWRRGKHLDAYSEADWNLDDRFLFEVEPGSRGLVVYDAQTLELVAQPGIAGDVCAVVGGDVAVWSDQHVSFWDGNGLRFLKSDWRGHGHLMFTPNGRHAISVSLKGELCIQDAHGFAVLEREPNRIWAMEGVTAFAVNPSGTVAAVVRGVDNAMATAEVVDLRSGVPTSIGTVQPIETLHFLDDDSFAGFGGRWVEPVIVTSWRQGSETTESIEVPGGLLGGGPGWIATNEGRESIVLRSIEGGAVREIERHPVPDGFDPQRMLSKRKLFTWDDGFERVVYDLISGSKFAADDGESGDDLLASTVWDDEYLLRVQDLKDGNVLGEWKGDVAQVVALQSRRQVYFVTNDGELYAWMPPDEARQVYAAEGLGGVAKSSDDRYLLTRGIPLRLFDASDASQPILELTPTLMMTRAEVAGEFLLVAGMHGLYAIYAIEP